MLPIYLKVEAWIVPLVILLNTNLKTRNGEAGAGLVTRLPVIILKTNKEQMRPGIQTAEVLRTLAMIKQKQQRRLLLSVAMSISFSSLAIHGMCVYVCVQVDVMSRNFRPLDSCTM